jgi:UDP-N-acetylmuramoyl-L-alanyl-D-glutamate--2,6-diaminopimelate ligase
MQLKILADSIPVREVLGPLDREVDGIFYDSRRVQKNGLYVAVRGAHFDGHKFTEQAIERGASAIVVERPESHSRATSLVVADSRVALADLAFTFFKKPALRLKMAGVTGTNGKTTTTFLIKHICEAAGLRSGLIGTVRYEIGERVLPATRTTPESLDLQELLAQMASAGCKAAVMEVSSHALAQERTRGLEWDVAVFTNLTQDHLDFHQTMEEYAAAKRLRQLRARPKPVLADGLLEHQLGPVPLEIGKALFRTRIPNSKSKQLRIEAQAGREIRTDQFGNEFGAHSGSSISPSRTSRQARP